MAFPSLTKKWHSEPYESIDPTRAELSARDKVVVITGGGGSIGAATAKAFARAGAKGIAIVGRRAVTLEDTKQAVESAVNGAQVLVLEADLTDAEGMKKALATVAEKLGKVNVLVANAGYLSNFGKVSEAEPEEWFKGFEINTKGAFNTCRALLPVAAENAILIDISTCVVHMPAMATGSAYVASKLAGTKVYETFGAENPSISVIHIHPGVVYSDLNVKSGITATDSADLPGCFIVWAVSPEAKALRGKYLWCNWDIDEMKSKMDELSKPENLTITMNGWPFPYKASGGIKMGN